eukprot:scaffold289896_cov19-Prasinocladus_malaysianus.AAC.1
MLNARMYIPGVRYVPGVRSSEFGRRTSAVGAWPFGVSNNPDQYQPNPGRHRSTRTSARMAPWRVPVDKYQFRSFYSQ